MTHPLDHPIHAALTGAHAALGVHDEGASRYEPDVSPFCAVDPRERAEDWTALARLVGPDGHAVLFGQTPPAQTWVETFRAPLLQMVGSAFEPCADPEALVLGADDVPDMLALVAATQPGPFEKRTIELGTYLGLRADDGTLTAMAGERLRPEVYVEISAVCTDPPHRGQGLASRLMRAVAAIVVDRGETPFLHVGVGNTGARRLYEELGFVVRRRLDVAGFTPIT